MFIRIAIIALALVFGSVQGSPANEFKEGGKEIGQGLKKMGETAGRFFKESGQAIGKGFKKAGKDTGKAMKEMGKDIGHAFKKGGDKGN